jgi:arylsulfatase A-like enzyme
VKRRNLLVGSGSALALAGVTLAVGPGAAAQHRPRTRRRPNVIVILADDLGYDDLACYGSDVFRTPHIDALAASGVRFTTGYVTHPVCAPSRAGLMTGRYQERFGYEFNPKGRDRQLGVSLNEIMLPKVMKSAGYATGAIGKWHMGQPGAYYPNQRGFDFFFGFAGGGSVYITDPKPGDQLESKGSEEEVNDDEGAQPAVPPENLDQLREALRAVRARAPITRNGVVVDEIEYQTDALTREALGFIDRNKDQPFFLYLAYHAPHKPLQATKKYYDRFPEITHRSQRIYAGMISAMDDGVGAVVAKLKAEGLDRDTLIFFLSDNGVPVAVRGIGSNAPFTGFKRTHFDGGVRVPFMVSWPGRVPAGQVDDRTVSSLDIFPTAAALAGAPLPADRPYDGVDLMPFLTGRRADVPNPTLYWRAGATFAIRDGKWKLIDMNKAPPTAEPSGGRLFKPGPEDPASLPPYPPTYGRHAMLFDRTEGPAETHNLAAEQPHLVDDLKAKLAKWNQQLVPSQWTSRTQSYEEYDGVVLHFYD